MDGRLLKFEGFELDPRTYHLQRAGRSLKLERIPMELLLLLVERRGQLVTREEIIEKLWGKNVFLDTDNAINTAVRKIRQVLKDDRERPRFVQTVTGKGYRFLAPLMEESAAAVSDDALDVQHPSASPSEQMHAPVSSRRNWYSSKFVALLVAVVVAGVIATYLVRPHMFPKAASPHNRVMLAVLPFQNLNDDPTQEYFSDGLTEETITDLGELTPEKLGVIARTSSMAFKHTSKTVGQIGHELAVDYVLEGSVRRQGRQVRISAQLIRVQDQTHIWAQMYDRETEDLLGVQNELGEAIAQHIQMSLRPEQKLERSKIAHSDADAYDDYLRGRYFWNQFTDEGTRKSVQLFQQAIEKDPSSAQAYAGLAGAYQNLLDFSLSPPAEANPKAEAAARKAVELDSGNSQAHATLGWQLLAYDRDFAGAEREFRRAIELNASNADAHDGYASYLAALGQFDQSVAEARTAREVDPLSPIVNSEVGHMLFYARQYSQAARELHAAVIYPGFPAAHYFLSRVYEAQGMYEEAYLEGFKLQTLEGVSPPMIEIREIHAKSGWKGAYQKALTIMLHERSAGKYVSAYDIAETYLALGDDDQTLAWLQKAADEHANQVIHLNVDPRYERLRFNPRFQDLLRNLHLPL